MNNNTMKNKTEIEPIKAKIELLKAQQAVEFIAFKEQLQVTYMSLKPLNLIKSTLAEVTSSPDIRNHLIQGVVGIAGGYLSKKLLIGTSSNWFKQIAGTLVQFFITKKIVQKEEEILGETELE